MQSCERELGELRELIVMHQGGVSPGWYLEKAHVTTENTQRKVSTHPPPLPILNWISLQYVFLHFDWIGPGTATEKAVVTLGALPRTYLYLVSITTGTQPALFTQPDSEESCVPVETRRGGPDGKVKVTLQGEKGKTSPVC